MHTIVITSNTSWYLYNFRKSTIIALINKGFKVIALAPEDKYSVRLSNLGALFIPINIDQGGTNPIKDMKTFFDFYKIYNKVKPAVVLNFTPKNNIYSSLAAKYSNAKVINNVAGLGMIFNSQSKRSVLVKFLYKMSQRNVDKIFFQNEDDRSIFLTNKLASPSITDRLPGSGVDLKRFSVKTSNDDGVVRFLLIARMLYDKGVGHYVEAARILRKKYNQQVEFLLLGFLGVNNPSAVSESQMQDWVDEGIVTYLGVSDSVEEEISKVDCMVLPSFYREGVPKSLLESGAMGKPIVTTDNVGCRETVDNGVNGFLCQPRSTESLISALELIIQMSHEERLKMGLESRSKMESEFNEDIIIEKYLHAIDNCLSE